MSLTKRISNIGTSATLEITSRAKKMRAEGIDVISFGAGEPDFATPRHIKEAAIEAIRADFTNYTPSSGIFELKETICEKFKNDNSLDYEPSQIVVSCGAKHSLYNLFQVLCQETDEVIIPSPYWVSYPQMVKLAGAEPVIVKTSEDHNFKLTEKLLLSSITDNTRVILLNSPSNPTGSVYSREELLMVADIAKSKGLYVVSDEIYEKIVYSPNRHISIASLDEEIYKLTITVNGVSKTYSMTGWRIGYLAGPQELARAISRLQDHSTSNPTSISQKAALAALRGSQDCVGKMVGEFEERRDYMIGRLNRIKRLSCNMPSGAFYVFCDISALGMGSVEVSHRLLDEAKVAVVPGEGFGWDTHIRLSFATGMEEIKEGLDRIERWARR